MSKPMRTFWVAFWAAVITVGLVGGIALATVRAITEVFR